MSCGAACLSLTERRLSSTVEIQSYRSRHRGRDGLAGALADPDAGIDVAALSRGGGPLAPAKRAWLCAQPGFDASAKETSARLVAAFHGKRLLNLIINDRGRFIVALLALDLHFRDDVPNAGLTSGRLKRLCSEMGVCSPTRVGSLLALMRLGDFVRATPSPDDRRRRVLVPTARLIASQRTRWRFHLEGSSHFLPEAQRAIAALDDDAFVAQMVRVLADHFYAGLRILDLVPGLRLFGERTGGIFVVLALLAAADDAALRGKRPVETSVSELARRTGTSRAHIIKLLGDAAGEGFIDRLENRDIVLQPRLVSAAHDFLAVGYLFLNYAAKLSLARIDGTARG